MAFLKWLGGGLGWVLGGPLGAVLGFIAGSIFDGTSKISVSTSQSPNRATAEGDFKVSLIVLIACVIKADGATKKVELDVVKRFFVSNFGENGALQALQILKNVLANNFDERAVAAQIGQYLNYSAKIQMLHFLFQVAAADGSINPAELNVIQRISNIFGISFADFESLKAPYFKQSNPDWAYKVLEITPAASNDEIKKAYRRMAMKFHPDKVNTLGEDVKKSANEKFRSINQAYEQIKTERGMM
ncbi:MAG: TerB family tellurite resistance protein [Paludibacter sp.]|jgi:DnaJ like chaperone protein|nr:TerB family tellurite resistance protein [Paludibacter sp.]